VTRWSPLLGFVLFVGVGVFWRSWLIESDASIVAPLLFAYVLGG